MDDVELRTLFATPPTDFVATRNALVKRLKQEKERDAATQVATMRRPAWTDFALNVTSRDHAAEVEAFASAAGEVREAQAAVIERRDGPDVRDTLRALREHTNALVERANAVLAANGRSAETPELLGRLSDLAGNPKATERLRHGLLGSESDDGANLFAGLQPVPAGTHRRPAAKRTAERPAREPVEPTPIAPAVARRRQREVDAAEGRLRRSRRTQREAESEAKAAGDAVAAAERTLELARRRLDKARSAAEEATAAVARDEAARDEALGALEETGA